MTGPQSHGRKSKSVAALLAIFLASLGAHRFYLRQYGWGIAYLLFFWTYIPGILGIIEGIRFLMMSEEDFQGTYASATKQPGNHTTRNPPSSTTATMRTRSEQVEARLSITVGGISSHSDMADDEKFAESRAAWVSPGKNATVQGKTIPGGMVYVGNDLRGVRDYTGTDAALIEPTLEIDPGRLDISGVRMSYWPAYVDIDPGCRATYLEWLSSGRRNPKFNTGYVFLFFYGLERRVFFDTRFSEDAVREVPQILVEVQELLAVYGENRSFRGYAENFLDAARGRFNPDALLQKDADATHRTWEIPLSLKVQVGRRVAAGEPIEPALAFSWLKHAPYSSLRTPGRRCPKEFQHLFEKRYRERFGRGLILEPDGVPLMVTYQPASRSMPGPEPIPVAGLPEIAHRSRPLQQLRAIADECCNLLDSYSRHVGRTNDRDSLEALALLPPELLGHHQTDALAQLVQSIETELAGDELAVMRLGSLLADRPTPSNKKVPKKQLRSLAQLLESLGFGIEPDVRFGAPRRGLADEVVVFRSPAGEPTLDPDVLDGVRLLQKLAIHVARADGEVTQDEIDHLAVHMESALHLNIAETARLRAHRAWLARDNPSFHGVRKRAAALEDHQRQRIARFLTTLACADGDVDSREVEMLTKIYPMLGLESDLVHSHLHQLQVPQRADRDDPVTVRETQAQADGFAIPQPETPAGSSPPMVKELDMDKVNATLRETEEVSKFLADIFSEEGAAQESPVHDGVRPTPAPNPGLDGLGPHHTELLRKLATRPRWDRDELETLTDQLGLFPDAALDVINDFAFEQVGAPVIEGFDEIEVDQELCREVVQ